MTYFEESHPQLEISHPIRMTHPLTSLTAAEVLRGREALVAAGLVTESTRFAYVMLREPPKSEVLEFERGGPKPAREIWALLTDLATGQLFETVVDLDSGIVGLKRELDSTTDGWGPSFEEDLARTDAIVKSDPNWVAALARRGVTDLDKVVTLPASAGVFGYDDEVGKRVFRVVAFFRESPEDIMWSNPIPGLVAHVAADSSEVLRVIETSTRQIPVESGNYFDNEMFGPERTSLKPISITQPNGRSFAVVDGKITWENWDFRVGFNGREGLTLHNITFNDNNEKRPILYRAAISEMVVNYGDPDPTRSWINYFDVGEFQFGKLSNSLELGCDCLGDIEYLDALIIDDFGNPQNLQQTICIHEEDSGILWKHTDHYANRSDTRRNRRLVVSFWTTVDNYDYGFYWYFYLDGTIELEVKATGIVFTAGIDEGDSSEFSPLMAPHLGAPIHQHLFSARLDMMVDGVLNAVDEEEFGRLPSSELNPYGNAFTRQRTRLRSESEARRDARRDLGTVWRFSSSDRVNRLGEPTSYVLHPEGKPTMLSADDSSARARAQFAAHHLWVSSYERDELWAAGYTVNQHPGGAGLPAYIASDRSIENQDIVAWHTFGLTHFPRTEDWPIMPVDNAGFMLKPDGFFDVNPTLDVPATTTSSHRKPVAEHSSDHQRQNGAECCGQE